MMQYYSPFFLCIFLLLLPLSLLFFWNGNRSSSSGTKNLNLPPSPPRLPLIGNLHQLGRFPHRSLRALSDKYGPLLLVHLGQCPTLVVSSPDLVMQICQNHDIIFSNRPKSTASSILFYGERDMAFTSYGEYWKQSRRICALHLLSLKKVQSFQSVREEEVVVMIEKLRKASLAGVSVNLSQILGSTSNNIVSRCILGRSYVTEGGECNLEEMGRRVSKMIMAFSVGDFFPSLGWIDVVRGFIGSLKSIARDLDAFNDQVIEEHKALYINSTSTDDGESRTRDFVDILLQLQKDGNYDSNMVDMDLTHDQYVKAIMQDMLLGGIESTSTLAEWFMTEVLRNPEVLKKAQEEVRRVVAGKPKIDMDDINRMDYFKCVLKETLRLHPSAPLFLPRETSRSVQIGGYDIPAKTRVLINGWAIQRHPGSWDRPEEFIPERFENNPVDCFKSQDYFQFIPFGIGRRQCPGMTFGIFSTEYMIANLLYWFDWKLPNTGYNDDDDELTKDIDMSEVFGLTVHKKFPLYVLPIQYSH